MDAHSSMFTGNLKKKKSSLAVSVIFWLIAQAKVVIASKLGRWVLSSLFMEDFSHHHGQAI